jgi:hypothetical protein
LGLDDTLLAVEYGSGLGYRLGGGNHDSGWHFAGHYNSSQIIRRWRHTALDSLFHYFPGSFMLGSGLAKVAATIIGKHAVAST